MSVMLPILSLKPIIDLSGIHFGCFLDQIVTRVALYYNLAGCHRATCPIVNPISEFKGEGDIYHALLKLLSDYVFARPNDCAIQEPSDSQSAGTERFTECRSGRATVRAVECRHDRVIRRATRISAIKLACPFSKLPCSITCLHHNYFYPVTLPLHSERRIVVSKRDIA